MSIDPTPVVLTAPAKLTLDLRITGVTDDGLHLIEAEMVTLDLADTLVLTNVEPAGRGPDDLNEVNGSTLEVVGGGDDIPTGPDNLVNRALALVGRRADVRLIKRIPSQAGLGGGSSDAGAILRWAGFDDLEAAASLGADVSFCTVGGRALVSGIGERVETRTGTPQTFTLLTPPVPCPTGPIYRRWDEMGGPRGSNGNDLEPAAVDLVPELARWRDQLGEVSGKTPRLAGSGSTWFVEGAYTGPGLVVTTTLD